MIALPPDWPERLAAGPMLLPTSEPATAAAPAEPTAEPAVEAPAASELPRSAAGDRGRSYLNRPEPDPGRVAGKGKADRHLGLWLYLARTQVWTGADYLSEQVDPAAYRFCREWRMPPAQGDPPCCGWATTIHGRGSGRVPRHGAAAARRGATGDRLYVVVVRRAGRRSHAGGAVPGDDGPARRRIPEGALCDHDRSHRGGSDTLIRNNERIRQWVRQRGVCCTTLPTLRAATGRDCYPDPDDSCPWCRGWCERHAANV